jgi:hypothetical protein
VKEHELDDDRSSDNEQRDDLPEFTLTELGQLDDTEETGPGHRIVIQKRTITDLAEIVAIANKDGRPIKIEECVLTEVQIASADIDVSIHTSVFGQKADFKNAACCGKLEFWNASFVEGADFTGAVFREDVLFKGCTFDMTVSFAEAVFEKKAAFTSCTFKAKVVFDNARFADKRDFSESTVQDGVSYEGTVFETAMRLNSQWLKQSPHLSTPGSGDMKKEAGAENRSQKKRHQKIVKPKTEFNPWRELDTASKKSVSRRDLLRGLFRFLPEKDEK